MKKVKKVLITITSLCMLMCMSSTSVSAKHPDIMDFVISGTGTENDPYILGANNPYKEQFDAQAKEAVQPSLMPLVDFSGTLTGPVYYGQTNGGIWNYTGGGPSSSSDNALIISGISYSNNAATQTLSSVVNNASLFNILKENLGAGLAAGGLTKALTSAFGFKIASTIGSIFAFTMEVAQSVDKNVINQALNKHVGILEISYRTSYHGSWFYTSCLDVWHTEPTAKTPGSYYGNGVYSSK